MADPFEALNIEYPLLLDGGLSNQLEKQGCRLDDPLWTALMLKENPQEIVKAHLAYLNAGAKCIISASYQATIQGFADWGIDEKEAEKLILKSVDLAKEAIKLFLKRHPERQKPLIAASIGPYGAYLADGSEYTGDYNLSLEELQEFHDRRIQLLDQSHSDLLACETIPSFIEAQAIAKLLANCKKQAWMSFSCKDEKHINDGTPIKECIDYIWDHPNIFAVGVNCTKPQYITSLIETIKKGAGDKRIVIYPNSGERYLAFSKTWDKGEGTCFSPSLVQEWLDAGADMIGGCCRVGPELIREINELLQCFHR